MLTVGFSTRSENSNYIEYIKKTSGIKDIEVIQKVNNGDKSLSQVYNEIINESKYNIVVCIHDDLEFDTKNWGRKLIEIFKNNNEYGIIGVAGTVELPESGKWWEKINDMRGIVNHKNNGKKWESKYSLNNGVIDDVVIVDGLFIGFDKTKIKSNFNESFNGFHFYDISFSYENFLKKVKIGVTYSIRVTHLSIGETNEKWEENRILFSEQFKETLPSKITYTKKNKLNILIACLYFQNFTGSEMYVFELAKKLIKENNKVTIVAMHTKGPLVNMAQRLGITVKNIIDSPGFKMGDGKWSLSTPDGVILSKPNVMYNIGTVYFDIIHCQHKPITELMIKLYPNISKICTIHSEIINVESPVIHESIKKYIAIRPQIKDMLIEKFNINEEKISLIYNPIDNKKFTKKNNKTEDYVLFVGTIDKLRKNILLDLIEYTKNINKELWIIGDGKSYIDEVLKNNDHIKHFPSTYNVEQYINNCLETAGILLGRTTIESWMCGKKSWIYNVDNEGNIIDKKLYDVPEDIEKYYIDNVFDCIFTEYINVKNT